GSDVCRDCGCTLDEAIEHVPAHAAAERAWTRHRSPGSPEVSESLRAARAYLRSQEIAPGTLAALAPLSAVDQLKMHSQQPSSLLSEHYTAHPLPHIFQARGSGSELQGPADRQAVPLQPHRAAGSDGDRGAGAADHQANGLPASGPDAGEGAHGT